MNTDTHMNGSTVKSHISLRTVFGYSATQRTSVRSWFLVYQRVLPQACPLQHPSHLSRQEIDHPTSSSCSSTSPPIASSTVSNESVARQERWDLCGIDSYPAAVASKHVERQEQGDLCSYGTPEEQLLTKPTKKPKPSKKENHERSRTERPMSFQEFRENLVDDRVPEHRHSHASSSHELSLEPKAARSADLCKHSVYTHFPKDRNCEICKRTKITRAPCRRTHWRSRTSCRKCWWFDHSRSQSSQWRLWISKQSSICSRGAGLGHPMYPIIPVQNKNFSGNTKGACKSSWSHKRKPKVIYRYCWKSSAQSKRRYLCSIVAIRSGWKLVGRFYGMMCLSAKHSGSLVWPYLGERPVKNPSIWKESLTWIVPWIRFVRGWNLEGWQNIGCWQWGVGNDGRIRNLL